MDALNRRIREIPRRVTALPREAPLIMPRQSLRGPYRRAPSPRTGARTVPLRRAFVFTATIAMTAAAAYEMYQVLQVGGLTLLETMVLVSAIRHARKEANDEVKGRQKGEGLSEDDVRREQGEVQKVTDQFIAKVEELLKHKEAEVMEV